MSLMKLPLAKASLTGLLVAWTALGQYKADGADALPAQVAPAIAQLLAKTGFRIQNNGAPYCEIWFRSSLPAGLKSTAPNVTLPNIPIGALLGVIRFDGAGSDRRGQHIQPGVYTLRYVNMPGNISHEGAAPQRDFLLLVPAGEDQDSNATPNFETLVVMSRKVSGTPHPAVLSFWKADTDAIGFSRQGDDWVLQVKLGDTPVAVILVGTADS